MKRSIVFLFMFLMMGLVTMAQPPRIRVPGATPKPTPPPIRVPNSSAEIQEQELAKSQGRFPPNTVFDKDKPYYSADKRYYFAFQSDGNLVVYKVAGTKAVWNSHTNGRAVKTCVFQGDGNLVLYDYAGKAVWNSVADTTQQHKSILDYDPFGGKPTDWSSATAWMVMQSDGNLVIYGWPYPDTKNPIWSSNSFERNK